MPKVLFVNVFSGMGGGERVMHDLVEGLQKQFAVHVLTSHGHFFKKYTEAGIACIALRSGFFSQVLQIVLLIKEHAFDAVHVHGTRSAFVVRVACMFMRKKPRLIYTLHGFHLPRRNRFVRPVFLFLERYLNRHTDLLVCVSQSDMALVRSLSMIDEKRLVYIPNGIDVSLFEMVDREAVDTFQAEQEISQDIFTCATIGRLREPKEYASVFRAVQILREQGKQARLLVVGDGPKKEGLMHLASSLGIEDVVSFLGVRTDIPTILHSIDALILSTKWEGMPLVLLEAAASRTPVVCSEVSGVIDVVEDEKTGLLFPLSDAAALARQLQRLADSKNLGGTLADNASAAVHSHFAKDTMIAAYADTYTRGL